MGLISHLKCCFKYLRKKSPTFFPVKAFFHMLQIIKFIEVPLFSETCPGLKNSWLRACYICCTLIHLKNSVMSLQITVFKNCNKRTPVGEKV